MADTGYISPGTMADDATPLIDSYSESYNDGNTAEVYDTRRYGQTFQNGSAITLDSCKLSVRNYATTTGNCRVKVYAHTGTFGTSGVPTGAVLATSDDLDASTFSTSKVLITFSFTSANRITLSADTPYVIVIEMPTAADYQHGISIGEDRTSPVASGNLVYSFNSGSTWIADENIDAPFYVYGAVGTVTWSNPDNAKANDGSYASAFSYGGEYTHYLKATNFGFSISSGAIINGIVIEIERKSQCAMGERDENVKIVKADGTIGTENKASASSWPSSEAYATYGDSTDLWSETWTAEDINDVDFGVVLSAYIASYGDIYVDHIRIKVYYTVASATIQGISTIQGIQSITL